MTHNQHIIIGDFIISHNYSPEGKKYPGIKIMSIYLANSENIDINNIPSLNFGSDKKNKHIIDKISYGFMTFDDAIKLKKPN